MADKSKSKAPDAPTPQQDAPAPTPPVKDVLPRTLAAVLTARLGRKVTDKRVRSVARDHIDRFVNRTGYTAHAYSADECATIARVLAGAGRGGTNGASVEDATAMLADALDA